MLLETAEIIATRTDAGAAVDNTRRVTHSLDHLSVFCARTVRVCGCTPWMAFTSGDSGAQYLCAVFRIALHVVPVWVQHTD